MSKYRALDLFCCAGGAGMGLHRAGFEVVGVDIENKTRYPFEFHQADALTFPLDGFDFIWASPPCQAFTYANNIDAKGKHLNLIPPIRARLAASGAVTCIENVPGAPIRADLVLDGTMFPELRVIRRRHFELNFPAPFLLDADKRQAVDEIDAEAERIIAVLSSRAPRATRTREIIEEFDPVTGEIGPAAPAWTADAQPANIKAAPSISEPEAAMLPQATIAESGSVNDRPAEATIADYSEPVTTPTAGPPPAEVTVAGDDRSANPPPSADTVVAFRTYNPQTHFLNSKGLQRLHGCLNPDVCAGSRSKLCFTCSTQHEGPAYSDGAA